MKRPRLIFILSAIVLVSGACAVKKYPREVTTIEKGYTQLGWRIDSVGAKIIPKYDIGRRYRLQRQTPEIEYSFYWNKKLKRDPNLFYLKPQGVPDVQVVRTLAENSRVRVDLIKWHSQYIPLNPDFALRYQTYKGAHTVWAVHAYRKRGNNSALVISHDWTESDVTKLWRKQNMFDYARLGYDSVIIQQPYHGLRRLPDMAFSGEFFISGEVARINEGMCQSVTDVRSMINWLRKTHRVVGVKGRGMGGTTSLMAAVVEEDVDFVIAWDSPSSLGDILQETPRAPFALDGVRVAGLDEDAIRKIVWISSPANYEPAIPIEHVLLISGMGDKFVPPEQTYKIMRKWGRFDVYWYAGGHLKNFQKKRCRRKERKFLFDHLPVE